MHLEARQNEGKERQTAPLGSGPGASRISRITSRTFIFTFPAIHVSSLNDGRTVFLHTPLPPCTLGRPAQ